MFGLVMQRWWVDRINTHPTWIVWHRHQWMIAEKLNHWYWIILVVCLYVSLIIDINNANFTFTIAYCNYIDNYLLICSSNLVVCLKCALEWIHTSVRSYVFLFVLRFVFENEFSIARRCIIIWDLKHAVHPASYHWFRVTNLT